MRRTWQLQQEPCIYLINTKQSTSLPCLRKEACSGSRHDLVHIPTRNCLADCITKASVKADNLITVVKTRRLLDVDIHLDFGTLMEHKAFLSIWCRTFMHTREKDISSNPRPIVPVLPLHQGPVASDHSADEDSEYSNEYSA